MATGTLRSPGNFLTRGGQWQTFVGLQLALWTIALISSPVSRLAALVAVGIMALSSVFFPAEYASFSIVSCILIGHWLTRAIVGAEAASPVIIETWAALFGLGRCALSRKPPMTARVRTVALWIGLLLMVDVSVFARSYTEVSYVTLLGSYLRFLGIVLLMYWMGSTLSRTDAALYACASLAAVLPVGMSVAIRAATYGPATMEELARARSAGPTDPNYIMVALVVAVLLFALTSREAGLSKRVKLVLWSGICVGLASLVFSASRTAFLALFAGTASYTISAKRDRFRLTFVVLCMLVGLWVLVPSIYRERLLKSDGFQESRQTVFANAWQSIREEPLFGQGHDYYRKRPDALVNLGAHNTILQTLAEGGVVYFAAWIGSLCAMARFAWHYWSRESSNLAFIGLVTLLVYFVGANGLLMLFWGTAPGLAVSAIASLIAGAHVRHEAPNCSRRVSDTRDQGLICSQARSGAYPHRTASKQV